MPLLQRSMRKLPPLALLALAFATTVGSAWADPKDEITPTVAPPQDNSAPVAQEFTMEGGYTGNSTVKQGQARLGSVGNTDGHFDYVASPQIKDGILLRFGVDAERNSFSLFPNAPLPNTLQSVNAIIGTDLAIGDRTIVRIEAHPGIYSDFVNISGSDFDCPVQIGGTYLYNKDFQLIFGMEIDLKSNLPIIGVPGFRWQFADNWVISAIPPKPQLQYQVNNALTLYIGGDILDGTYHLNDAFGNNHGHGEGTTNSQLNNNICDFTEVRAGAGFTWKFTPNLSLDVSGGYVPYREFDLHPDEIGFDQHNTTFRTDYFSNGAPYAEAGISGSF